MSMLALYEYEFNNRWRRRWLYLRCLLPVGRERTAALVHEYVEGQRAAMQASLPPLEMREPGGDS